MNEEERRRQEELTTAKQKARKKMKRPSAAILALDAAIEIDPTDSESRAKRAECLHKTHRYEESIRDWERAIEDYRSVAYMSDAGRQRLKQYEDGLEAARQAQAQSLQQSSASSSSTLSSAGQASGPGQSSSSSNRTTSYSSVSAAPQDIPLVSYIPGAECSLPTCAISTRKIKTTDDYYHVFCRRTCAFYFHKTCWRKVVRNLIPDKNKRLDTICFNEGRTGCTELLQRIESFEEGKWVSTEGGDEPSQRQQQRQPVREPKVKRRGESSSAPSPMEQEVPVVGKGKSRMENNFSSRDLGQGPPSLSTPSTSSASSSSSNEGPSFSSSTALPTLPRVVEDVRSRREEETETGMLFCEPCGREIPAPQMKKHLGGRSHKLKASRQRAASSSSSSSQIPPRPEPPRPEPQICRTFQREGSCRHGDRCWNIHQVPPPSSSSSSSSAYGPGRFSHAPPEYNARVTPDVSSPYDFPELPHTAAEHVATPSTAPATAPAFSTSNLPDLTRLHISNNNPVNNDFTLRDPYLPDPYVSTICEREASLLNTYDFLHHALPSSNIQDRPHPTPTYNPFNRPPLGQQGRLSPDAPEFVPFRAQHQHSRVTSASSPFSQPPPPNQGPVTYSYFDTPSQTSQVVPTQSQQQLDLPPGFYPPVSPPSSWTSGPVNKAKPKPVHRGPKEKFPSTISLPDVDCECHVCMEEESAETRLVLLTCGHVVTCESCLSTLEKRNHYKCPQCTIPITAHRLWPRESDFEETCLVCYDAKPDLLFECGHVCWCNTCFNEMTKIDASKCKCLRCDLQAAAEDKIILTGERIALQRTGVNPDIATYPVSHSGIQPPLVTV